MGYYEKGERKPDIEILYKIADFYQVSADYLIDGRNSMRKIAEDAGAIIKIGKSVRVNFTIMDNYLDALSGE